MSYKIEIEKPARKFIAKQPADKRELLLQAIAKLPDGDVKAMRNRSDVFRLRVGTYRILYRIYHGQCIICVIQAGNRGQIYKRR